jgi:hypothetical protein
MTYTVTVDGAHPPAERRHLLERAAAALDRSGTRSVLVDWVADGMPGWRDVVAADPVRLVGRAAYGAALDDALGALGTVDWEPGGNGDPERDRALYRLAASLAVPAAVERVVHACLDPAGYLDRDPYADDGPDLPRSALYSGLVEADLLVGVDWKSSRTEAATAVGRLRILPDTRERLADAVAGFAELLRRCDAGDRADRGGGPALPAGDPLRAEGEQPEPVVAQEVAALAGAASIGLLRLDNGDTPGYVACRAEWAARVLDLAAAAGLPLDPVDAGTPPSSRASGGSPSG